MMKPYTLILRYTCSVRGCPTVWEDSKELLQGEQLMYPNTHPSGWTQIGGSLVCSLHQIKIEVDGKADWWERK